jgi:hypothetical protein
MKLSLHLLADPPCASRQKSQKRLGITPAGYLRFAWFAAGRYCLVRLAARGALPFLGAIAYILMPLVNFLTG